MLKKYFQPQLKNLALWKQSLLCDSRSGPLLLVRFLAALGFCLPLLFLESSVGPKINGLYFFSTVIFVDAILLPLAALFLFLPLFIEEKRAPQSSLVMMTGISPAGYLMARLGSRLLTLSMILLLQIPLVILSIALGGLELANILKSFLFLATYGLFCCSLFGLISYLSRNYSIAVPLALSFFYLFSELLMFWVSFKDSWIEQTFIINNVNLVSHCAMTPHISNLGWKIVSSDADRHGAILCGLAFLLLSGILCSIFLKAGLGLKGFGIPDCGRVIDRQIKNLELFLKKYFTRGDSFFRFGTRPVADKDLRFTLFALPLFALQIIGFLFIGTLALLTTPHTYSRYYNDYFSSLDFVFHYPVWQLGALLFLISFRIWRQELENNTFSTVLLLPGGLNRLLREKFIAALRLAMPTVVIITFFLFYTFIDSRFINALLFGLSLSAVYFYLCSLVSLCLEQYKELLAVALCGSYYLLGDLLVGEIFAADVLQEILWSLLNLVLAVCLHVILLKRLKALAQKS